MGGRLGKSDPASLTYLSSEKSLNDIKFQATTATNTKVSVGTDSTSVLSANTKRTTAILVNDSDTTIYIAKGTTAVVNEGIRLNANGGAAVISDYSGAITAISSSASKNLTVCET